MQDHNNIKIASELDLQSMQRGADMTCEAVLDLRFNDAANARPVEEEVLLRLRNLQIGYEQLPVNLHQPDGRHEIELAHRITERGGRMMIITDQPEAVSALCSDLACDTQAGARAVLHHELYEVA
ncbi:MAG: hypothetical protein HKP56_16005 [Anderseniella sp.]|nr:hypothetical protein [Anderseniella sp.]